jgi:putative ABC transport system permease protein
MTNLLRDLRFGFRLLRKNPGFAAVAILALALGIGANTAIFSVIYSTLLEAMPYPQPNQIVMVWSKIRGGRNGVSAGDYLDWKQQSNSFQELSAWSGESFNLSSGKQPEQIVGRRISPGFFSGTFGTPPVIGRDFLPEESEVGKDHELILTHKLWQERFGGAPNIIGQQVRVNGESYSVVGVLAEGVYDRLPEQMFAPLAFKPEQLNHDFHWLLVAGRLKPGVSIPQAQANMNVVTGNIANAYPKSNKSWGASVELLQNDFLDRDFIKGLWLLMGAVAFVLLIACVNVANLLLARGMSRQKEIAVRSSVGASGASLFWQFLAESLVLAAIGGVAGIVLAWGMLKVLIAAMPPFTLPSEADVRLSLPVLGFTLAATVLSGILFGCAPAWHAARLNLNEVLKEGGRSNSGASRHRLRRILVVVEFALALTLLAGAGLTIHSFWNLRQVDLGIRKDHILTFSLPVPNDRFAQPEQITEFYKQLLDKLQALPGVTEASASTGMPLEGTNFGMPFTISGKAESDPSSRPGAGFEMATPGYFQTFGIQIVKGRAFTDQDTAGGQHVALVNENFAKRFLGGTDPLTQRVLVEQLIPGVTKLGPPIEWQIIGVFHDVKGGNLRNQNRSEIDVPFSQSPWPQANLAVRTTGDPAGMSKNIAAVVQSMDPDLPVSDLKTMDQILDQDMAGDRFDTILLGTFAAVALILSALGIYGVMAFAVAQRTHEIGLRMALGAGPGRVLGLILKEGMILTVIGLVFGLAGAFLIGRAMQSELFGIGAIDPVAFGAVAAVLVASALFACYIPARRAMRVDPMIALRYE